MGRTWWSRKCRCSCWPNATPRASRPSWRAPAVIGTGPLLSKRPPELYNGRPRFGSLTRFHIATVPATAEAYDPDTHLAATAALVAKAIDPQTYRGRVARNALKVAERDRACFDAPEFPMGCTWLDSQARIEDAGGIASIRATELAACSPVVFYARQGGRAMRSGRSARYWPILGLWLVPAGLVQAQALVNVDAAQRARATGGSEGAMSPMVSSCRPRPQVAPPLVFMGYVDVGFADAEGERHELSRGRHPPARRLRRGHLRAGGQQPRGRRLDRGGRVCS